MTPQAILGIIAVVALFGGLLGGATNFFFTREQGKPWGFHLATCLVAGVSAAMVTPLFLIVIQSDMLKHAAEDPLYFFAFFGLCILAGLSSRKFLHSVASEALKLAKDAQSKAKDVEDQMTEPDVEPKAKAAGSEFSEDEEKVLKVFPKSSFRYRSFHGIGGQAGLTTPQLKAALDSLVGKGILELSERDEGKRYSVSKKGYGLINPANLPDGDAAEPAVGGRPPLSSQASSEA
jgi:hypothetical protein